jgi:hypothetical protein
MSCPAFGHAHLCCGCDAARADAAVARAERAEATLEKRYSMGETEQEIERKIADDWCAKHTAAQAQVRKLREALAPMLAVLDAWVADRSLLDSTPLHNIRAAARAVLKETE